MSSVSVRQTLSTVLESLNAALVDAEKCDRGNKAAGTRVRAAAQDAVASLKELRKQVVELRKTESVEG
jgi:hypothetical protein